VTLFRLISPSSFSTDTLNRIIRFLYFSNLLISIAALALGAETFWLLDAHLHWPKLIFLFLATLGSYTLHDFYTKAGKKPEKGLYPKVVFWQKHGKYLLLPLPFAALGIAYIALRSFSIHEFLVIALISTFTLLYTFPLLPFRHLRRWKNHPISKILVLALVWTAATTILVSEAVLSVGFLPHLITRFFFILMLCIPFDARDAVFDRQKMQHTLLDWPGISNLQKLTILLPALATIALWLGNVHLSPVFLVAYLLHLAITSWLCHYTLKHRLRFDLYWLLDVQMILQALIVGLSVVIA
jgi:hypothetical protein